MRNVCTIEGCDGLVLARGWCNKHYRRWYKFGDPHCLKRRGNQAAICGVEACGQPSHRMGMCADHQGDVSSPVRKRTGSIFERLGYQMIYYPEHPNAHKGGAVAVHTVVMSELLGRPLHPWENVHHKNGVRNDNRPENLELWARPQTPGQRVADLIEFANWVREQYGVDPERYDDGWKGRHRDRQQYLPEALR